jgi:isopenicillin-N epimerase
MATVPLPLRLGAEAAEAARLKDWLLFVRRIEVPIVARGGRLWARVSAQVYNDDEDIENLAAAVDAYGTS